MDAMANGFDLGAITGMLRRRMWTAIVLFSVSVAITASVIVFLPNVYTASAFILVEGQQVPQEFVRSTVTMDVERRLQVISQEVLSRVRLEDLVSQFDLYGELRQGGASMDAVAAVMRRDIGLAVKGKGQGIGKDTVAFEVNYSGLDPQKVMQVTNTLASFYIEGNLKVREQQALGTTEFLRAEIDEVQKRLEEQEERIVGYKKEHLGELPAQMNANIATLSVLQKQMEIVSAEYSRARERRELLTEVGEIDAALSGWGSNNSGGTTGSGGIGVLQQKLAGLRNRFSDKHPDIIRIKQQLATLEEDERLRQEQEEAEAAESMVLPISSTQVEQAAVEAEIRTMASERADIQREIAQYKARIENMPKREQELAAISRDYDTTRGLYDSLLKRYDEARLADSLEQRQKAERFRLLEAAAYPQRPAGPNRGRFLVISVFLGLGAAAAGVFVREMLDASFHAVEDLQAFTTAPVLVSVPLIMTMRDRRRRVFRRVVGATALVVVLLGIATAGYWVAADNAALVRFLVRPSSAEQLR
jgi:polysaccharide chain length determinant protein (PEP-CTERM system associated)